MLSKLKRTGSQKKKEKKNVSSLRFKLEVFIWCHVVYAPKSSRTFQILDRTDYYNLPCLNTWSDVIWIITDILTSLQSTQ